MPKSEHTPGMETLKQRLEEETSKRARTEPQCGYTNVDKTAWPSKTDPKEHIEPKADKGTMTGQQISLLEGKMQFALTQNTKTVTEQHVPSSRSKMQRL